MSLAIRPATAADAAEIAHIYLAARAAALPGVRWAHDADDVRHWVATVLVPDGGVFLAAADGQAAGFLALEDDFVGQLWLRPGLWRRRIGSALLNHAKALRPAGLQLYCFQANARARAFYEAQGFAAQDFSDGATNEEREPDILYAWQGQPPAPGAGAPRRA